MKRLILDRRLWPLPIALWTAVVGISFAWNVLDIDRDTEALATTRAHLMAEVLESVRLWNARHGGVYAPVSKGTLPNPHLQVPDRDLELPSGKSLTLINPAYMTRQIAEILAEGVDGVRMDITSLKPLNPDNKPDPWEAEALKALERGPGSTATFAGSGEGAIFRYMAPLVTEKPCLQCHEHQGYRVGDIRGGISVTLPVGTLLSSSRMQRNRIAGTHGAVWLLLSVLTVAGLSRLRTQMLSLKKAKEDQQALVLVRTRELREEIAEHEQTENRLRLLLESSGEGIYGVDTRGRCTFCNPIALQLLGLERSEQIIGRDVHERVHGAWHGSAPDCGADCPLKRAYQHGEAAHIEEGTFWTAHGRSLPVEYRAHPIHHNGELVGAVVTFADISSRKASEQQLRKLSQAVEHSPESVIITDAEGCIEYVNAHFQASTGYASEEVIGKNPRLLQSGETPAETYEAMWRTITDGQVWHGEFRNRRKNGELFWEETSIAPITDETGRVTHFVGINEDITERKRLEKQIWRQANYDELTGLVNRHLLLDRLEHRLHRAKRDQRCFALLFIDLDGFKEVNDTLGHDAGDELLRQVANRLLNCVREGDTVARVGGDEFTVILPRLHRPEAGVRVAEKILAALAHPFTIGGKTVSTSASIGIATYPDDGEDAATLMKNADRAMYAVKHRGRSGIMMFCEFGRN
ncbi:diguanylate cyclase domain-containing protein [Thiohalomonas denitrificans]|uniref:diguanylate cyclase domain-containing protein n=1 Tax=Thiohalomonas denitrificans TaxID=415747 RepID=UPI0026EF9FFC|nr:diguanylate cyclase [Thiohalomonas denitrificans]